VDAVLRLINVIHEYPQHGRPPRRILDNVTLDVAPGEVISVCGLSGCGKSTLARIAAGLITPTAGEVRVNGNRVVNAVPPRGIGLVFQNYHATLFPWLTVEENVALGLPRSKRGDTDRVTRVIDELNLTPFRLATSATLSGGQQQRVAIARALVSEPSLLILDEAFSSLDFLLRKILLQQLRRLVSERNLAVLFVTHDIDDAILLAERVLVVTEYINATNIKHVVPIRSREDDRSLPSERTNSIRHHVEALMQQDLLREGLAHDRTH
jgi:ABC-type nitrate/sulfonate/bicarbonate transport system ATPase subunit